MDDNEINIASTSSNFQVTALLGDSPVKVTDGFGGWKVVDRPRKTGMTQWQGINPFQVEMVIMLDGLGSGPGGSSVSQESKIKQLMWMARPKDLGKGLVDDPPTVKLTGQALPFPIVGAYEWVINGLEFGDQVIWTMLADDVGDGISAARVRQDVTLNLVQFVDPDRISIVGESKGLSPKPAAPYTVRAGETLNKLAVAWYGDINMASTIADANNIRDPKIVKKGYVIKHIP